MKTKNQSTIVHTAELRRYNQRIGVLNRLSCEALLDVDDFREILEEGIIPEWTAAMAKRLMKLARLQAKVAGTVLFMTWKE